MRVHYRGQIRENFRPHTPQHIVIDEALYQLARAGRKRDNIPCHRAGPGIFLQCSATREDGKNYRRTPSLKANTTKWYMDDSKTDEGIGAGVFGTRIKHPKPMGTYASGVQAGTNVIGRCVQLNLDRNYPKHCNFSQQSSSHPYRENTLALWRVALSGHTGISSYE